MKIVSSGRVLNSREFYEKKRKRRRIKSFIFSVGFLSVLYLIFFLLRQERFLITDVIIQGENIVDKDDMAQVAQHLLDGQYLWLIPRANSFIYPRGAIKQSLISKFPRLKSANLKLDKQQNLLVNVEERVPFALYCRGNDDCFFIDEGGFIFAPAPSFSAGVYFIYFTQEPVEDPIGKRFITEEAFRLLLEFKNNLTDLGPLSQGLEIGDDQYALLLANGGRIIWRSDNNLNLIQSNLEAFLSSDVIRAQSNFLERILYLDLRTENKVFYKFK